MKIVQHSVVAITLTAVLPFTGRCDDTDLTTALSPQRAATVHEAVDRGLAWLATQQNADGSFKANNGAEPPTTALSVLAFLSRGHQPGQGTYGRQMTRGIDYLLSTQRENGAFAYRDGRILGLCHPVVSITLTEVYGSTRGEQAEQLRQAITRALSYSRTAQTHPGNLPEERGGWRHPHSTRPELPPTVWGLMFLRSASNAGFEVPQQWVDEGVKFVRGCYLKGPVSKTLGIFKHSPLSRVHSHFGKTGMGLLALQLHSQRDDPMSLEAATWLIDHEIPRQGEVAVFYRQCYVCGHAMAQMGGTYWATFYPRLVDRLLPDQAPEGYWRLTAPPRMRTSEAWSGPCYNTALAVLTLTLPDQLLPVHQR